MSRHLAVSLALVLLSCTTGVAVRDNGKAGVAVRDACEALSPRCCSGSGRHGWVIDEEARCAVAQEPPTPKASIRYRGGCEACKATGQGELSYFLGEKPTYQYHGDFLDGRFHGTGTLFYPNGGRYEGQWKDGKRNGTGTYADADGSRYQGEWRDGREHGTGTLTLSNGDRYVGSFKGGKRSGKGSYTSANGDRCEGLWTDDEMHFGHGICTSADGSPLDH